MRFRALDSWRGIAAVVVVFYHCVFLGYLNDNSFVRSGYLFVDFFFVLSGFVIAHAYRERIGAPEAAAGFLMRRFGRLWPLHAAMLAAFALAEGLNAFLYAHSGASEAFRPSINDNTPATFLANVFMLNAVGLSRSITWNGASWSIGAEFCAYLVFAGATLYGRAILTPLSLAIAALGALAVGVLSTHQPPMDASYDLGFLRCLYGFFVGVVVHAGFARPSRTRFAGARATLAEVGALALAVAFMGVGGRGALGLAAPLVFAPLVYVFASEGGALSRALMFRPFAALGAWSYSIYMTQGLIANAYDRAIPLIVRRIGAPLGQRLAIGARDYWVAATPRSALAMDALNLVLIALVIAVSWRTFRWIEEPARRYFNRVASRFEASRRAGRTPVAAKA
jgi:hypothetical protein